MDEYCPVHTRSRSPHYPQLTGNIDNRSSLRPSFVLYCCSLNEVLSYHGLELRSRGQPASSIINRIDSVEFCNVHFSRY